MSRSRRRFLQFGTLVGISGLAGCGIGSDSTGEPARSSTTSDSGKIGSPTQTATPGPDESPSTQTGSGSTTAQDSGKDWPTVQLDNGNTGFNPEIMGPKNAKVAWRFDAGNVIASSPVFQNGLVYTVSVFGNFYSIRMDRGAEEWHISLSEGTMATPTILRDTLHLPGISIDPSNGKKTGSVQETNGRSVKVVDNMLYKVRGYNGYTVTGIPLDDNKSGWEFTLDQGGFTTTPAVGESNVFVSDGSQVYAIDRTDGSKRWAKNPGAGYIETRAPTVRNGRVFVDSGNKMYAFRAETGEELWSSNELSGLDIKSSPAVTDDTVYVCTAAGGRTDPDQVFALDVSDGSSRWSRHADGPIGSSPATDGESLYFVAHPITSDNPTKFGERMIAMDTSDGTVLWSHDTGQRREHYTQIISSPAVGEGVLFVGSHDGHLYAFKDG